MSYIFGHSLGPGSVEWPHSLLNSKRGQNVTCKFVIFNWKKKQCQLWYDCHAAFASLHLPQKSIRFFWGSGGFISFYLSKLHFNNFHFNSSMRNYGNSNNMNIKKNPIVSRLHISYWLVVSSWLNCAFLIQICIS